jgi:epoxide hydrolase 4
MILLQRGFIQVQDQPEVKLHFVEMNHRAQNPLILFLHGFPEDSHAWRNYFQPLCQEGYHCVAVDLRGYNESTKLQDIKSYRMEFLVHDIEQVLLFFGKTNNFLVGHDWGGLIGWELALKAPQLLRGLITINAPFKGAVQRNLKGSPILFFKQLLRSWYIFFFQLPFLPEEVFLKELGRMELSKELIQHYKESFKDPRTKKAAINYYRANLHFWRRKFTGRIKVPVLFIWGENDKYLEKALAAHTDKFVSDFTKRSFPRASHWVHHEHFREIIHEITFFISLHRYRREDGQRLGSS